jgi:hypothetical protein
MAFVQHVDDALVLALSSLRMNYNINNNNDDNNYSNNYNNYNDNKISISTDNRNNACMTSSLSPLSTALSIFDHSQIYHTISQFDYKMDITDIYNDDVDDDGYTDSVPSLMSLVFDKKDSLLNFPENLVKIFNYSDWKKLHEVLIKYADPQVVTTLESWHGMHLIGIDSLMKYFITMIHSKPDMYGSIVEVEAIHQSILAKTSWYCTDIFHLHEQLHNSNHQNDIIVSNISSSRILRILPQMNLKNVHSNEVREILDLLESKHDLLLSGETFMHLTIDRNSRKMVKFHMKHQFTKVRQLNK